MKRRLTKLVVFLLLGAIVNVAVAWGCQIHAEFRSTTFGEYGDLDEYFSVHVNVGFGITEMSTSRRKSTGADFIEGDAAVVARVLPKWGDFDTPLPEYVRTEVSADYLITESRRAEACGWPLRCLWAEIGRGITRYRYDQDVWFDEQVPATSGYLVFDGYINLPIRPFFPGFAINTIFYAAILWLLTLGPFTARRMIRRKRGHCIKCGYDLRGDFFAGCPECGWRREEPHG